MTITRVQFFERYVRMSLAGMQLEVNPWIENPDWYEHMLRYGTSLIGRSSASEIMRRCLA